MALTDAALTVFNRSTGLVARHRRIAGPPVKIGAPLLSAC